MGFKLTIGGEVIKEIDVDPRLVEAVQIGSYRIPVAFNDIELDVKIIVKSVRDAEFLESLKQEALTEVYEDSGYLTEATEDEKEAREQFAQGQADPDKQPKEEEETEETEESEENLFETKESEENLFEPEKVE